MIEPSLKPKSKIGTKVGNTSKDNKESKSTFPKYFFKNASSKDKAKIKDVKSEADTDAEARERSDIVSTDNSIESNEEDKIKKPHKAVQTKLTSKRKNVYPYAA
jgi:hypothetical protein